MITRSEKNKKIQKKIFHEENQKKLRKFSKIIGSILGLIILILLYGMFIGSKVVIVKEYKVTSNELPNSFHGVKVVHISDILYNSLNEKDLNTIQKKINELKPDIIVFTGNLKKVELELSKKEIEILENFFKDLNASLEKYAIIGNKDDDSFYVIMENSNFKVMNNKQENLYRKDSNPIEIIGFDTNNLNFENLKKENYSICLFSNPDKINDILKNISCNLALAGETLGGEIKLFNKPLLDNHKYNSEYSKIENGEFYISNGLGNEINVRYFNHPAINFYRLTKY